MLYKRIFECFAICAAPPGLDNILQQLSHRLRSGLLLRCPYRGITKTPLRGVTTVAHCVSGGKAIARVKPRRGDTNSKTFRYSLVLFTGKGDCLTLTYQMNLIKVLTVYSIQFQWFYGGRILYRYQLFFFTNKATIN